MNLNTSSLTNSSGTNGSVCAFIEETSHPFLMVVYGLVFLAGLVLNCITVRVYFCQAHYHHSSVTVFLKNLAVSDFLQSLSLPLRIANYASGSTLMKHIYCCFGASAFYLNMYASILFMEYIAANRYLKIVRPLGNHSLQTVRAAHVVSIATWSVLVTVMSVYITLSLSTSWGKAPVPRVMGCDAVHSPQISLFYKIIHSSLALIFLFVLISLVLLYRGTVWKLRQAQHTQRDSCKKLKRSRRNMLVLVSVFCVCFVPYHLVRLPYAFLKHRCEWIRTFYYLKELTVLLSVFNVCLDPLVYFFFCKAYRSQLGMGGGCSSTHRASQTQLERRRSTDGHLTNPNMEKRSSITNVRRTSAI